MYENICPIVLFEFNLSWSPITSVELPKTLENNRKKMSTIKHANGITNTQSVKCFILQKCGYFPINNVNQHEMTFDSLRSLKS